MIHLRNRYFLLLDVLLLILIPAAALGLREDYWFGQGARPSLYLFTGLALLIKLPIFYAFGLYRRYWRYASVDEMYAITVAVGLSAVMLAIVFLSLQAFRLLPGIGLPRSVPFLDGLLTLFAVGGTRFSVRVVDMARRALDKDDTPLRKRVLVVGAGDAGAMIVREMRHSPRVSLEPVGFVDDDLSKRGVSIHGIPVLGSRGDIPQLVEDHRVAEVIIAMPTASGKVIREIVTLCEAARVPSRTMPGIYEILSGRVGVSHLRNVDIEDLLRREPVTIDYAEVARMLTGMRVLVTGAGGSIGSELCRQIMRAGPACLLALGHGENSLFTVSHELRKLWPRIPLNVVVADVRDRPRLEAVFRRYRPQIVFHAAAHKHVPLMEENVEDAVTNNVLGTRCLVELAQTYGAERFVLISSDKAVNPTNVMGVTKRVAELIVQQVGYHANRPFVSVRFGNVLGSRGSVVPFFRQQIASGGPVTVTHPDMTRYFMTIPEAVQLVLQAGTMGQPGDVFVLDMGEPIKIVDLATDLVELSGLKVGRDIDIEFVGLRPGEKLHEELFASHEAPIRTRHQKIFRVPDGAGDGDEQASGERELGRSALVVGAPGGVTMPSDLAQNVDRLVEAAQCGQVDEVQQWLKVIEPAYHPSPAGVSLP